MAEFPNILGPLMQLNNQVMRQRELDTERAREDAYREKIFRDREDERAGAEYDALVQAITTGSIENPDTLHSIATAKRLPGHYFQSLDEHLKRTKASRKLEDQKKLALGETPAVGEGGNLVALSRLPGPGAAEAATALENLRATQRQTFGEDFPLLEARQEAAGVSELENLRAQRTASQADLNRSRATLLSEQRRAADSESKRLAPMRDALANQVLALGDPGSDAFKSGIADISDQIGVLSADPLARRRLLNEVVTVASGMRAKGVAETVARSEKRGALYSHFKAEGYPDELASQAAREAAGSTDGMPKTVFPDIEVTGLPIRAKDAESSATQSLSTNALAAAIANFQTLSEVIAQSNPTRLTPYASRTWESLGSDSDPTIAALGSSATDLTFSKVVDVAASTFNQKTQDILSSQVPRTSQLANAWDPQTQALRGAYAARIEQLWQSLEKEHLAGVPIRVRGEYSRKFQEFKAEQLRLARERNNALYGGEAQQANEVENVLRGILTNNPQMGP